MLPLLTRTAIPPIAKGYPLEANGYSWFSLIIPVARTNLITNPSGETNTTSWAGFGSTATINRVTTQSYYGGASLQCTSVTVGTDSAGYNGTLSLSSGQLYAVQCKFLDLAANGTYELQVQSTTGTVLARYRFKSTGRWQWVWLYYSETSSATRRIHLASISGGSGTFYLDGVQVEAINTGETLSTYIDGDQQGLVPNQYPPPYGWNATPHASTSYRTGQTRAGGMIMPLSAFGFVLMLIAGLGMVPPQNISIPYVQLDGAQYERTQKPPRQFTLVGRLGAANSQQLDRLRGLLESYVDRDLIAQQQPLVISYQKLDECGNAKSDRYQIVCSYAGGLEETTDNHVQEQPSLVFQQYLPSIVSEQESAAVLSSTTTVTANFLIMRTPAGAWQAVSSGLTGGTARTIAFANTEYMYVGGAFTDASGVANTRGVARYSFTTGVFTAMGTGGPAGTTVRKLAIAPNGDVAVVGNFANMGGAATSAQAARWNVSSSTWTGLNYPVPAATVVNCVYGPDGTLYTGDSNGNVYKYTGAWTLLGTAAGAGTSIDGMTIGPDGNLYIGGAFSSVSGTPAVKAARYTLNSAAPAWQALSSGPTSQVYDLAFGTNGMLYAATDAFASTWNGSIWTDLSYIGSTVRSVAPLPTGAVLFSGSFTGTAQSVPFPSSVALWSGGAIGSYGVVLPGTLGTALWYVTRARADGTVVIGGDTNGSATTESTTTVTNTGKVRTYPIITITGPTSGTARIYQILNVTTNRSLFLNYIMNAGETATFVLDPANLSFTSDFRGNIASVIEFGSTEADFFLQPGANTITYLVGDTTMTVKLRWRTAYASLSQTTL